MPGVVVCVCRYPRLLREPEAAWGRWLLLPDGGWAPPAFAPAPHCPMLSAPWPRSLPSLALALVVTLACFTPLSPFIC